MKASLTWSENAMSASRSVFARPGVIDTDQFRAANPGSEREHWLPVHPERRGVDKERGIREFRLQPRPIGDLHALADLVDQHGFPGLLGLAAVEQVVPGVDGVEHDGRCADRLLCDRVSPAGRASDPQSLV